MNRESIITSTTNKGGYSLELIAMHDTDGMRNTRFVVRVTHPYEGQPIDFIPSQEDFREFGIFFLGLSTFTNHNLYTTGETVEEWDQVMSWILRCLGLGTADEMANKTMKLAGQTVRFGDLAGPIRGKLLASGKNLRGRPPFVP
jgi:hypothetical protein